MRYPGYVIVARPPTLDTMTTRRDIFPPIEPYQTGRLRLDNRHTMYWEQSGNPRGAPALFLHGGPGAGANLSTLASRRPFKSPFFILNGQAQRLRSDMES